MIKKVLLGALVISLVPLFAFAQYPGPDVDPNPTASTCVRLNYNLRYQTRDSAAGGEVSTLQDFLQSRGYLSTEPTGYFGLLTQKAVMSFQNSSGITPASGYVGPITRARIAADACGGTTVPDRPITQEKPSLPLCPNGNTVISSCQAPPDRLTPPTPPSAFCPNGYPITLNCNLPQPASNPGLISFNSYAKAPNIVVFNWEASDYTDAVLEVKCEPGTISFSTDKGNNPSCDKGGVWSWTKQKKGKIEVMGKLPSGYVTLTVPFTLSLLKDGIPTGRGSVLYVSFNNGQTQPIKITNVRYSPTSPKVNEWIITTVNIANSSSTDYTSPFQVVVQGTAVTVQSLNAGAQTAVTVPNAFTFSYPGTLTLKTVIVYPVSGRPGSGNTGDIFTNTLTFVSESNATLEVESSSRLWPDAYKISWNASTNYPTSINLDVACRAGLTITFAESGQPFPCGGFLNATPFTYGAAYLKFTNNSNANISETISLSGSDFNTVAKTIVIPRAGVLGSVVAIGAQVSTTTGINVRVEPSLSAGVLGGQSAGASGRIVSGPVSMDGYTWWKVYFSTGANGWVAGEYLQ